MFKYLLAVSLLVAAVSANAVNYTDIWYNPRQPGYGFPATQSDDGTGKPYLFIPFFIFGPDNSPTWYVAGLTWNGTDAFTGDVYNATGTFFGVPWVGFTAAKVGSASFKPNPDNNWQATFSFAVIGGSATYALERETLTANFTGGTYVGIQTGQYSGCVSPANSYSYTDPYQLQVDHGANGAVSFTFSYYSGYSCTLTGTYVQHGQYLEIPNAQYQCTDGPNGTAQVSQVLRTPLGLEGVYTATGLSDGCTENARFGGLSQ